MPIGVTSPLSWAMSLSLTMPQAKKPKTMTRMNQRVWKAPASRKVHAVTDSRLDTTTTATGTVTSSPPTVPAPRLGVGALRRAMSTAATMSHATAVPTIRRNRRSIVPRRMTRSPRRSRSSLHCEVSRLSGGLRRRRVGAHAALVLTVADHNAPVDPRALHGGAVEKPVVQSAALARRVGRVDGWRM